MANPLSETMRDLLMNAPFAFSAASTIDAQRQQLELLRQGLQAGVFTANEVRAQMGLEMPDANVPAFIDTTIKAIRRAEEIQARYGPGANEPMQPVARDENGIARHVPQGQGYGRLFGVGPVANPQPIPEQPRPRVIHHCGFCGKESREGDSWCCQRRREAHEMPAPPIPTDWMFTAEAARAIQPALPPAPTKTRRGYRFEDFPEEG